MNVIMETPRLLLREISMADLDFIATLVGDPEVMRFYPKCYSREEAASWIQRDLDRYAKYGHGMWLVVDKTIQEPVGRVGLAVYTVDGVEEREIGYIIHRPFWRQGYAYEAALATRDYAFATLHVPRVISLIRPVNLPSQAVARKLGMRPRERTVMHADLEHMVFELGA